MIAFFIHLHMVRMRDDKNVMKITNNKKISVLLKLFVSFRQVVKIVPVDIFKGFGKLEE